jgi:NADPH:quinone reductase-like Zn-dependent oxidoreductase
MKSTEGSYAEYVVTSSDLVWEPSDSLSDQQAATFGVSFVTAVLALYKELGLPVPTTEPTQTSDDTIFVYAGSASASLFVIQLAKLAGLKVITTCSKHNFDLVKSYGADFVYDSRATSSLAEIQQAHAQVNMAFDGLSTNESTTFCATLLKQTRGKLVVLLDTVKFAKSLGVEAKMIMMYTALGEQFAWLPPVGPAFLADPAARDLLVRFYRLLPSLLDRIKPLPTKELDGGLENIPKNMQVMKAGSSGAKLTMRL